MKKEINCCIILLAIVLFQPGIAFSQDNANTRECDAPYYLYLEPTSSPGLELFWSSPVGFDDQWIQWDDGVNFNSIGNGGYIEFDVAVRWTPEELSQFNNGILTTVAFIPGEPAAAYNIRVWQGTGNPDLIIDQAVDTIITGEWNYITLDNPLPIDISTELWVGYFVNTYGYPAGCDDGPAIDGSGNMINFGGWQTLLQTNPELDYNWNIQALIEDGDTTSAVPDDFVIYRSDNVEPYFILGYALDTYFFDDSAICDPGTGVHGYKVTARYFNGTDTCESEFSNESVFICPTGIDEMQGTELEVYPNPARDYIQVEIRDDISTNNSKGDDISVVISDGDDISIVKLLNSNGHIYLEKEINANSFMLPVADYPPGIYLLGIETNAGAVSEESGCYEMKDKFSQISLISQRSFRVICAICEK